MNLRILIILAVVVAAIGGAAYHFSQERKALQSTAFEPGPLIADLETRINDVDEARLESQEGGVLTLVRREGQWAIAEHYGYPANGERVAGLLQAVATLKKIEPKTAKPENFARLNLDDPAGENALGTRITLKSGEATVADIVVGLNQPEAMGGGVFVRQWDEDQTWLAEGEFKPKRRLLDLLDRNVVNVDGRRIRSARIQHPPTDDAAPDAAGEAILISKATPDQEKYSLGVDMPEGAQPKPDNELSSVARLPDFLILEDVKPATEIDMERPVVGVFETFDGLRLTMRAARQGASDDAKTWVTVTAAAAARDPELDAFIEANKGQDSALGRIADEFKTPAEIDAEVEKWARKTDGWAYKLTDYKTQRLTVTTDDLVEIPKDEKKPTAN